MNAASLALRHAFAHYELFSVLADGETAPTSDETGGFNMRKLFGSALSAGALFAASAAPAAAAPNERACHPRPNGASHGTVHAHHTVPHSNHQAHMSIPRVCRYPD